MYDSGWFPYWYHVGCSYNSASEGSTKLNAMTEPDLFPLPRIVDLLDKVEKARRLTKLDMAKGYHRISTTDTGLVYHMVIGLPAYCPDFTDKWPSAGKTAYWHEQSTVGWCTSVKNYECQQGDLLFGPLRKAQPVKSGQRISDGIGRSLDLLQ